MSKRVYLSGPIKDIHDPASIFRDAELEVALMGIERDNIVNPMTIESHKPDSTVEEYMREDLKGLLTCDTIYMLRGWEKSVGARMELMVACICGLRVLFQ